MYGLRDLVQGQDSRDRQAGKLHVQEMRESSETQVEAECQIDRSQASRIGRFLKRPISTAP